MSEKEEDTSQKEYLPFQVLIRAIDHYVAQHEVKSDYVWGYVNGLEKAKEVCMQLLDVQEKEIKEIFEQGQKNPKLDSDIWFEERHERVENTFVLTTMKENAEEEDILNSMITSEAKYQIATTPKYFRVISFCFFHVFSFFYFTLITIFLILTLQFKKVSRLPKIAEQRKQNVKRFLNL